MNRLQSMLATAGMLSPLLVPSTAYAFGRPTEWSLPSGLTILHQYDPRFPIVRVLVTVGGGTADTAPGQRPLAHLAEHVAFRTMLSGGPAMQTLRAAGCEVNAFTALDATTFQVACPTDAASLAVTFAAALATHDFAGLAEADVRAEARIVLAETTQRSDAGNQTWDQILPGVFTGSHPYASSERVPDDLLALRSADVQGFFDAHYVPSKVVIAVQGDMDAPALAGFLSHAAGDGFAHPHQRRGDIADWPAGAIQIQWLSPTPATWFRDPDDPTRPLDPGRPAATNLPAPPVPEPDTSLRRSRHSGTWPEVQVAWYLPPARHDNWIHLQESKVYAEDTLRAVYKPDEVIDGGCESFLGTRGSALVCTAELESEDLLEGVGRRIAEAFGRDPGYEMEKRQRTINDTDARSWQNIVGRDQVGLGELADLSAFRLATGRFDLGSARTAALGGTGAFAGWTDLRRTWLSPERAVVTLLSPEPRDSIATEATTMDVGVPAQLLEWPAPALGPAGAEQVKETVLKNGLRTVILPIQAAEVGAWRLSVPSLPGLEHLDAVIDAAIHTPDKFEGNALRYNWSTRTADGGTVLEKNQRGAWEPRHLLRALWATVEARKIGDVHNAFHRYVKRYVYSGRSPYNWRWRAWRRATREDPERDGLFEIDEAIRAPGAVKAYLQARYQPDRATLFLIGRESDHSTEQIEQEMGDWRATSPPSPDLPVARRRAPSPEAIVLDDNNQGRTVSVMWACPVGKGKPVDPLTAELLSELAYNRLYDVVRASSGLTYTPSAWTDIRWGGVDLMVQASTELGQERQVLAALRGVVRDLAKGASGPVLTAARRQVLAGELHAGSSVFGLAYSLSRGVLHTGSLAELRARRAALPNVDASTVATLLETCETVGDALLVGPAEEVARNLAGEAMPVRVFDWRAEQLELVKRWAPAMYRQEKEWLDNARGAVAQGE